MRPNIYRTRLRAGVFSCHTYCDNIYTVPKEFGPRTPQLNFSRKHQHIHNVNIILCILVYTIPGMKILASPVTLQFLSTAVDERRHIHVMIMVSEPYTEKSERLIIQLTKFSSKWRVDKAYPVACKVKNIVFNQSTSSVRLLCFCFLCDCFVSFLYFIECVCRACRI